MSRIFLIVAALLLLPSPSAQAFCRMTVEEPMPLDGCPAPGTWLEWRRQCITYSLVDREPRFDDDPSFDDIRDAADRSFARWSSVECDGDPIGLDLRQTEELSMCDTAEYSQRSGNTNSIFFVSDWLERGLPFDAFGLTMIWHNPKDGEIYDADMQLNETQGQFEVCDGRCPRGSVDLENVITHEAGHFLGLGHSEDENATMHSRASLGETSKRTLDDDDVAGLCEIYGELDVPECTLGDYQPDQGFNPTCVGDEAPLPASTTSVCSVALPSTGHRTSTLPVLAFAAIGLWVARRRRRDR